MILRAAAFVFGLQAVAAQILLVREYLVVAGGSELALGVFYAAWFLGIFAGSLAAVFRSPREDRLPRTVAALLLLQAILLCAAIPLVRSWRTLAAIPIGTWPSFHALALAGALAALPFGFLTGFLFPALCRLWGRGRPERDASAIGTVYAIESIGSLVGGMLVTFLVIGRMTPMAGAARIAALVAAVSALLVSRSGSPRVSSTGTPRAWMAPVALAVLALLFLLAPHTPWFLAAERASLDARWKSLAGPMQHVAHSQTRYQQIDLGFLDEQYSLLLDGQFADSFPDPYAAEARANLLLSQSAGARRILLVGGVATVAPEFIRDPSLEVVCVEIDPGILDVTRPFLPAVAADALRNPRLHIEWNDPRRVIARIAARIHNGEEQPFDLVAVLSPDPLNATLNRLFTREFFREAAGVLSPGGVFVLTLGSAVNYFGEDVQYFTGSVYATLGMEFPFRLATPGETTLLFATRRDDVLTSDPAALESRFQARALESTTFDPAHFRMAFDPWHTRLTNDALRDAARNARVNTDLHPVTYALGLRLWSRFSGSALASVFRWVGDRRAWEVFLVAAGLIVIGVAFTRSRFVRPVAAARASSIAVLLLTGLAGIALSLVLLLAYQSLFGCLYGEIGALVGLFMAGLAAGGFFFRYRERLPASTADPLPFAARRLRRWLIAFSAAILLVAATLSILVPWGAWRAAPLAAQVLLAITMIAAGAITGAEFAMVGHLQAAVGVSLSRRSAWLESADHLGAAVGALATGIVLLPCLGIPMTLVLLAFLKWGASLWLAFTTTAPPTLTTPPQS